MQTSICPKILAPIRSGDVACVSQKEAKVMFSLQYHISMVLGLETWLGAYPKVARRLRSRQSIPCRAGR